MTRYYKVLRQVTNLDREKAPKRASQVLKTLPPSGYVTTKYLKDAGIAEPKSTAPPERAGTASWSPRRRIHA